jgi:hypothetical protein
MENTIPWTWAIGNGRPFQSIKGFHFIAIARQTTLNVTQKNEDFHAIRTIHQMQGR